MYRYFRMTLLVSALILPVVVVAQDRDDKQEKRREATRYEDKSHHDSHEWNEREGQAYGRYLKERHKKDHEFTKAGSREQQDYWNWRHSHPDEERH